MMNKSLSVAIVVMVTALFAWYSIVRIGGFELFINVNDEINDAYLARLMKDCNLTAYTEDYYVNSDTQTIGRITSIDFRDNGVELEVGKSSLFFGNNQSCSKRFQGLDANNNPIKKEDVPLNEFSTREVLRALLPGNWVRIDKGPSGPTSLVIYCHE